MNSDLDLIDVLKILSMASSSSRAMMRRTCHSRRTVALYSALIAVVAGFVLYVHTGYFYGYNDHTLLSIKGIAWADSSAFRNDWFNNSRRSRIGSSMS